MNGPPGPLGPLGNMRVPNIGPNAVGNPPMGGPMGNMPAVPGLPAGAASAMNGPHIPCFESTPEPMQPNPYQQQYFAAMMNQPRPMGNERFQPMMYRPVAPANYMPPFPYPYPYPYPYANPNTSDSYSSYFSDENTTSCNVM